MAMFSYHQLRNINNVKKSKKLFSEYTVAGSKLHSEAIFCENDYDRDGLVSLKRLYLELAIDDPSEYTFAMAVFGEWEFWEWLRKQTPVKHHITEWEHIVEVSRKSKMIQNIQKATKDPKTSLQASRYLLERGFEQRPSQRGVDGRKSRRVAKEETAAILQEEGYQEDLKRLAELIPDNTVAN